MRQRRDERPSEAPPAEGGSAWTLPAFRLFLVARAISWAGNAITLVAMPMLVYQLTGSAAPTGLITALEAAPYLLLGFPAGALADRWDRKRMLVVTGAASGLLLATIPAAALLGEVSVGHLLAVAAGVSTLFVFFDAASFGAVPELVGRDRIPSATGAMVSVSTVLGLAGPAVGGLLAATVGATWAIGVDAVAYLVAAVLTARVGWPTRDAAEAPASRSLVGEILEGLRYIWDTRIIRLLTVIGAGASVSGGAVAGLLVVAGVEHLGLADDDGRLGLLFTATALGAFLMSLLVAWIQKVVPTGWITIVALGLSWAAQVAWALTTSLPIGFAVLAIFQAASTLSILNGIIVRQSLAPDRLQSRVNTTARMIAWGGTPLGAGLGGLLAQRIDLSTALLVCSLGTGLALSLALATRLWRVPTLAVLRTTEAERP